MREVTAVSITFQQAFRSAEPMTAPIVTAAIRGVFSKGHRDAVLSAMQRRRD